MKHNLLHIGAFCLLVSVFVLSFSTKAHAATFNPNDVIDDGVFDNVSSMTAAQINSFLNQFPSSCISTGNGFSAPDPTGYNPTNGFLYGGSVSAGQVIYDSAQAYDINPQVLLTTLEKEQSLVTGGAGCSTLRYAGATGYGCPDSGTTHNYSGVNLYSINGVAVTSVSGTCVSTSLEVGFSQQIIHAAWLLKFGEQRSQGNVTWEIIKGNWDNSDDPQSCYSGPMTQGTWQICPGGPSVYYDGYDTIDGTSVLMDTGATAALYWYTPHFAGNENFVNIFDSWFGSTLFPQPTGGALYIATDTDQIFLVIGGTTSYYIPNWDMMINYDLSTYPLLPETSSYITSTFTSGGTLTNLIDDNGNIDLVNNGSKYYVSPAMCTAWGLGCLDTADVVNLGSSFQDSFLSTGMSLQPVMASGSVVYEMENGDQLPIANPTTLSDLGFNWSQIVGMNPVNTTQPLGPLLMTTPAVVMFPPNNSIYYYDGENYHYIPSYAIMQSWGFDKDPVFVPQTSSYNTTLPTLGDPLNIWTQISSTDYVVDGGIKYPLSVSQQALWPSAVYQTFSSTTAQSLPTGTLGQFVWSNPNIYILGNGVKQYVPTISDLISLGYTGANISALSPYTTSFMPDGPIALGNGTLVDLNDGTGNIYVVNNNQLLYIPNATVFNDFGFNWGAIRSYDSSLLTSYPEGGTLSNRIEISRGYSYMYDAKRIDITAPEVSGFGLITGLFSPVGDQLTWNAQTTQTLTPFMYDTDNGAVYYGSGGALHYVSSRAALIAYGGTYIPWTIVDNSFIQSFIMGQPI
ncbi:MAG TPA: hypothetical protein VMR18_04085 [Candidatus Saccharimonadales bacterium]|nr:hypothetical protein [Candidatus Saccharimonadales bacterium]